jgi:hypothetical protein
MAVGKKDYKDSQVRLKHKQKVPPQTLVKVEPSNDDTRTRAELLDAIEDLFQTVYTSTGASREVDLEDLRAILTMLVLSATNADDDGVGATQTQVDAINLNSTNISRNASDLATFISNISISNNKVGIGTTSPDSKLHVYGTSNPVFKVEDDGGAWGFMQAAGSNQVYVGSGPSANLSIYAGLSSAMTILASNRNVGIGTTSPGYKLEVNGTGSFFGNIRSGGGTLWSDSNGGVQLGYDSSDATGYLTTYYDTTSVVIGAGISQKTGITINGQSASAGNQITFRVGNAERMRIDGSGNVGIGTTSPTELLEVYKNGGNAAIKVHEDAGTHEAKIHLRRGGSDWEIINNNDLAIESEDTELFRIKTNGRVGIGTTAPDHKFHVEFTNGDTSFSGGGLGNWGSDGIRIENTYGGVNTMAMLQFRNGDADIHIAGIRQGTNDSDLGFFFEGSEKMRIDSSGNVGIGTTSPDSLLEISSSSATDFLKLTSTTSSASPIKLIFEKSSSEQSIIEYNRNGDLEIYNNDSDGGVMIDGSASAGGDLYVNNAGNVGIGTTSPGEKLDVNGNVLVGGGNLSRWLRFKRTDGYQLGFGEILSNSELKIGGTNVGVISFHKSGAEVMRINDTNVGIGTTSPSAKLEVSAGGTTSQEIAHFGNSNGVGKIKMQLDGVGSSKQVMLDSDNNEDIVLSTQGDSYFNISHGNVGIGTTSPTRKLDVAGDMNLALSAVALRVGGTAVLGVLNNLTRVNGTGGASGGILFTPNDDNNEKVRITSDGKVGIGTDSPSEKLEVSGKILATGGQIRAGSYLESYPSFSFADDIDTGMFSDTANQLEFVTGGSSRVTINSVGNVGIGTTSPVNKLDVGGDLSAANIRVGSSASGEGIIRHSAGSGYGIGIVTGAISSSSIGLFVDHSTNNRNVGIGTTSPSEKLEVAGNISLTGSVQKQISTTHHTFTFGAAGSASQDYWVPFIGSSEQAAPNVTHRTIAPYGGILKKAIVHSTVAYGSSAQVRFHRIDNGTSSVFVNDNSTDDVTTNVTADMSTAYSSVAFDFTTGNTFSAGDQIGVSFVRNNTAQGDVAITLVWEYELF